MVPVSDERFEPFVSEKDGFVTTISRGTDGSFRFVERDGAGRVVGDLVLRSDGRGGWTDLRGRSIYPPGTPPLPEPPRGEPSRVTTGPPGESISEYVDGTTVQTRSDGTVITAYADGTEVECRSSGVTVVHDRDGSVLELFPDGTTRAVEPTGVQQHRFPDGLSVTTYPDGSTVAQNADGSTESWTPDPDGTLHVVERSGDGTRTRERYLAPAPRGAFPIDPELRPGVHAQLPPPVGDPVEIVVDRAERAVTRRYADGTAVTSYPDRRVSTRYPDGARAEVGADGTLVHHRPDGTRLAVPRGQGPARP
jgi:hypothetical protein